MKRIILFYGLFSGAIIIGSVILGLVLAGSDTNLAGAEWLGYLIMLVALSLVFLGIKRYRDEELGGVIRFGTATMLGLGITLAASVVYVAAWEVYLSATDYAFMEQYAESVLAQRRAEGASEAALATEAENMAQMQERYANPLFRLPMTFLEIFPVGLLITLISAALLRRSSFLPARS